MGFALWLQTLTVMFYFLAGPLLARILPWDLGIGPWLVVDKVAPRPSAAGGPASGRRGADPGHDLRQLLGAPRAAPVPGAVAFHAVHHSVEDMDAASSYVHPVDVLVERTVLIALGVVLKADFDTFIWAAAFATFYDRLIHSRTPSTSGSCGTC